MGPRFCFLVGTAKGCRRYRQPSLCPNDQLPDQNLSVETGRVEKGYERHGKYPTIVPTSQDNYRGLPSFACFSLRCALSCSTTGSVAKTIIHTTIQPK